jgi:hypothetical protein
MFKGVMLLPMIFFLFMPVNAPGADFPYGNYEALLKRHVKTGVNINGARLNAVDYAALSSESKRPDSDYSLLLKELAAFDPSTMKSREEKIAFWVNVYNIGAMKTIVDHYPVDSIRSRKINWLGLPWSRKVINVGGRKYSLAEIENDILLEGFRELRIHFGINCASVSCVDLLAVPYRAANLFSQLEEQGRKFLADRKRGLLIDRDKKAVYLSQIFKFDKKHFDALGGGVLVFIKPYLTPSDRAQIEGIGQRVDYLDYNWNANDLKGAR